MKTYITLSEFIEDMLQLCKMEGTKENKKKFRVKFTRELKELGIWENAPEKLIGRKKTKVFTTNELEQLKTKILGYLAKQAGYNPTELAEIGQSIIEANENYLFEEYWEKEQKGLNNESYWKMPITQTEENNIMLKAIFELFFTPIDTKQWQHDRELVNLTDPSDDNRIMSLEYTTAIKRLKSHNMNAYYKQKKKD